jgi:hypothetical protein
MPARLTRPTVGFMPTRPQMDDGLTIEPSVSVPTVTAARLAAAAAADPRLLATAERNTRAMLEGLLRGLGYERIAIDFRPAPL